MQIRPSPQIREFVAATFEERGVAVPFTTPLLLGARVRLLRGCGIELLIPNPSGARGIYVLSWDQVGALCRPTVHDRRLNWHLQQVTAVAPPTIREAARHVAVEGLAGRRVRAAARRTEVAEREAAAELNLLLLVTMLADGNRSGQVPQTPTSSPVEVAERLRRLAATADAGLGMTQDSVGADLAALACVFVPIGMAGQAALPRVPDLLLRLARLRREILAWAADQAPRDGDIAQMIGEAAGRAVSLATCTVDDAREALAAVPALLRRWQNQPDQVRRLAARPEWLLDGWNEICLLWDDAETADRRSAALAEMAMLLPGIPKEVSTWVDDPVARIESVTERRTVLLKEDWRCGSLVVDLVSRNERLLARAH